MLDAGACEHSTITVRTIVRSGRDIRDHVGHRRRDDRDDRDPLTLDTLTITDPNGTERGTLYDGFDRPVMSTVTPVGGTAGAVSMTSYLGFNLGDSGGRRIVQKVFTDKGVAIVPLDDAPT